ncbi:MAG: M13 family metallopeptidase [Lachnospiraceae bacterium]|nr:M13 family metallopeptidase [Lachnospiraceae bacterium]
MKKFFGKRLFSLMLAGAVVITTYVPVNAYEFSPNEIIDLKGVSDTYGKAGNVFGIYDINGDDIQELFESEPNGDYIKLKVFKYKKSTNKAVKVKTFSKVSKVWGAKKSIIVSTPSKPADSYTKYKIKGFSLKAVKKITVKKVKGVAKYSQNGKAIKKAEYKKAVKKIKKGAEAIPFGVAGYPWIDSNVIGYAGAVGDVGIKNDAHLSFNYEYLSNTDDLDGRRATVGGAVNAMKRTSDRKKEIFTGKKVTGKDSEKVRMLFKKLADFSARDAVGIEPLKQDIERIQAISSIKDMTAYLTDTSRMVPTRFVKLNSTIHSAMQGIRLPDVEYDSLQSDDGRESFDNTVKKVLKKIGYKKSEANRIIKNAVALDETLVKGFLTDDKLKKKYPSDNCAYIDGQSVSELCKNFPLTDILKGYGSKAETYGFATLQTKYFSNLDNVYKKKNLELLKDYMIYAAAYRGVLITDSDTLVSAVSDAQELVGRPAVEKPVGQEAIDSFIADLVAANDYGESGYLCSSKIWEFAPLICNAYVSEYYDDSDKKRVSDFAETIVDNYEAMLSEEDWLAEETKKAAIEKLRAMDINVLYPDTLPDLSYLDINETDSVYTTFYKAREATQRHNAENEGKLLDLQGWRWDLDTIFDTTIMNSFYLPTNNSVYILGGYVDGKEDISTLTNEELYGFLGLVIGHEISHAFDSAGAKYDKDGVYVASEENPSGWWTDEDWTVFEKKVKKMAKYYNGISPLNGVDELNGSMLTGEAIADMGGMAVLLRMAGQIEGFDYDKFFREYSKGIFLYKAPKMADYLMSFMDVHPLGYLRTNVTVAQFDEFYKTYDITKGDGMYIAPKDRVKIW